MIPQFELPWSELITLLPSNIDDLTDKAQNQTASVGSGSGSGSEWPETSSSDIAIAPPTAEEIREIWRTILKVWREGQGRDLIIIRGAMAIVSFICSMIFMWMILRSNDGLKTTQHRLLLGLCIADIIYSSTQMLFGVSGPKELDYVAWNARGSMNSCIINGTLRQFGLFLGTWYNASLCLFFLAVVKYKKSDEFVRKKIEPFLHGIPFSIALGHCVLRLSTEGLNPNVGGSCAEFVYNPPHCHGAADGYTLDGIIDTPCGRGKSSQRLNEAVYFIIVLSPAIIMIISLTMIYKNVRKQEKKIAQYGIGSLRFRTSSTLNDEGADTKRFSLAESLKLVLTSSLRVRPLKRRNRMQSTRKKMQSQSRTVLNKAVAYSCSWLMTWIFWLSYLIHNLVSLRATIPIPLLFLFCIFMPLQGVYNLAIYMHPRIISAKRSRAELTWWQAFVSAFWSRGTRCRKRGAMPSSQRNRTSATGNRSSAKSVGFYSFKGSSSTIKGQPSPPRNNDIKLKFPGKHIRDDEKSISDSIDEEEGEVPYQDVGKSLSPQLQPFLIGQHTSIAGRNDESLIRIRNEMNMINGKDHDEKKDIPFNGDVSTDGQIDVASGNVINHDQEER